ncbi:MAG: hypothetical protein K6A93_06110 [Bacteroidaceae bacterium]|nr:hypothetical protein [Bacteroidaceae bacterium]
MTIKLHRYYGDDRITKSVMEVWLDGDSEPRMVCEARESSYKKYEEAFAGASRYCLPVGRWRMKAGGGAYSPMGLRVPKCPGHRQVWLGHSWCRQCKVGEILIGEPAFHYYTDEEGNVVECPQKRRIEHGEEVFKKLDALVYEAFGKMEEFYLEIDNKEIKTNVNNMNL